MAFQVKGEKHLKGRLYFEVKLPALIFFFFKLILRVMQLEDQSSDLLPETAPPPHLPLYSMSTRQSFSYSDISLLHLDVVELHRIPCSRLHRSFAASLVRTQRLRRACVLLLRFRVDGD